MTDYNKARDFWAGLDRAGRAKILDALKHDQALVDHDFAALPPQTHAGVVAGMPVEPAAEVDAEGNPLHQATTGPAARKRKGDD